MPLTKERVEALVAEWRTQARRFIWRYAVEQAPHVPEAEVDAVVKAIGEVSIDEATHVLDRLERDVMQERRR
jgi:hypothetical protein